MLIKLSTEWYKEAFLKFNGCVKGNSTRHVINSWNNKWKIRFLLISERLFLHQEWRGEDWSFLLLLGVGGNGSSECRAPSLHPQDPSRDPCGKLHVPQDSPCTTRAKGSIPTLRGRMKDCLRAAGQEI